MSHWVERVDGVLLTWLLSTRPFRHLMRKLGIADDDELACEWEVSADYGSGKIDKAIMARSLPLKMLALGEWKTSLVMDDDMRRHVKNITDVVEDEDAAPLDPLALFVHSQGKTAHVYIYGLPSNIPKVPDPVVRSFAHPRRLGLRQGVG